MTYFPTYRDLPNALIAVLLAGVVIAPLTGIPVPVGGIPVWYQDTFFYAWIALSIAGVIAVVGLLTGYFQQVQWNSVDRGVMASWSTFAMFSYPMSIPALMVVLPVSLSGINTTLDRVNRLSESMPNGKQIKISMNAARNILSSFIVLGISIDGAFRVIRNRPMVRNWMAANANLELQHYDLANTLYDNLFVHLGNEGLFLQYAGKSHSLSRQFHQSGPLHERALFFTADPTIFTTLGRDYTLYSKVDTVKRKRAEFLLTRAKYISPYKYYPRYLLVQYYTDTEEPLKAIEEAEDLLSIEPKVISPATK